MMGVPAQLVMSAHQAPALEEVHYPYRHKSPLSLEFQALEIGLWQALIMTSQEKQIYISRLVRCSRCYPCVLPIAVVFSGTYPASGISLPILDKQYLPLTRLVSIEVNLF